MPYRSSLRPPPRWRWLRRRSLPNLFTAAQARAFGRPARLTSAFAAFLCVLVLALVAPRGAGAYPCGTPPAERTLSSATESDCRKPGTPTPKRGETDFVSLAFFVAGLVFVLLIPLRYSTRGE
jgi:hypothetical protein